MQRKSSTSDFFHSSLHRAKRKRADPRPKATKKFRSSIALTISFVTVLGTLAYSHFDLNEQVRSTNQAIAAAQAEGRQIDASLKIAKGQAQEAKSHAEELETKLDGIENQLRYEGPVIWTRASYHIWRKDTGYPHWTPVFSPIHISPPEEREIFLEVFVINEGRYQATVTGFAIQQSEHGYIEAPTIECFNRNSETFVPCDELVVVESQKDVLIRVAVNSTPELREATCASVNDDGLHYRVDIRGTGPDFGQMYTKHECV